MIERDVKGRFTKGIGRHSEVTKKKMRETKIGFKNPNWKGGKGICRVCGKPMTTYHRSRCKECFLKDKVYLEKRRELFSGSKNPQWKGGITLLTKVIRNLPESESWRKKVFVRDEFTCQECGQDNCYLEAHHIKPFREIFDDFLNTYSQFSPIEDRETLVRLAITYKSFFDIRNGKSLCLECHEATK